MFKNWICLINNILSLSTCIWILGCSPNNDPLELLKSSKEEDNIKGTWIIIEQGYKDPVQVTPYLKKKLLSPDSQTRNKVVTALGKIRAKGVVSELVKLLSDKELTVRDSAVWALGRINSRPDIAVPALVDLAKKDTKYASHIVNSIAQFGPDAKAALPYLEKHIYSSDVLLKRESRRAINAIIKYSGRRDFDAERIDDNISLDDQLLTAARKGMLRKVKLLLKKGANINYYGKGSTPLYEALSNAKNEVAIFLIDNGADVNLANTNGITPLAVVANRNEKMVRLLISKGANVNAKDCNWITILMYACTLNSNSKTVKILVENGAEVNAVDKYGSTALDCINLIRVEKNLELLKNSIRYEEILQAADEVTAILRKHGAKTGAELRQRR